MNSHFIVHARIALLILLASISMFAQSQEDAPAGAASESAEPSRASIVTGMDAETIANRWPDSAIWLTGESMSKQLAMFEPEADARTRGAIVVLGDEGQSAASDLANALRASMSRKGWGVLSLGLEPPPFAVQQALHRQNQGVQPAPESPPAETEEPASSVMIDVIEGTRPVEGLADYRARIAASLTAAVNQLREREYQRIVLVGIGWAAGHVTRQAREDGRASDLVWVTPRFHADESAGLTEILADGSGPPILELYSTFPGDQWLGRAAKERAAALKRAGVKEYSRQPVAVSQRPQAREADTIANRVSAWLITDRQSPGS